MVINRLTKMVHFIPCTKIVIREETANYSLTIFIVFMDFQMILFWTKDSIYFQFLERTFSATWCEDQSFYSISSINWWTNSESESNLGVMPWLYYKLSIRQLERPSTFGWVCLQQYFVFINKANSIFVQLWSSSSNRPLLNKRCGKLYSRRFDSTSCSYLWWTCIPILWSLRLL